MTDEEAAAARVIMPEGTFTDSWVEGEATNQQILNLINARLLVSWANELYEGGNRKTSFNLDPDQGERDLAHHPLTMERLEEQIAKVYKMAMLKRLLHELEDKLGLNYHASLIVRDSMEKYAAFDAMDEEARKELDEPMLTRC